MKQFEFYAGAIMFVSVIVYKSVKLGVQTLSTKVKKAPVEVS